MLNILNRITLFFLILFFISCSAFRGKKNYCQTDKPLDFIKFKLKIEYVSGKEKSKFRAILKESKKISSLVFLTPLNKVVVKIEFLNSQACVINLDKKKYAIDCIDNLLYDLWGLHIKYRDFLSLLRGNKIELENLDCIFSSNGKLKSIVFKKENIYLKIDIIKVKKIRAIMQKSRLDNYKMVDIKDVFR